MKWAGVLRVGNIRECAVWSSPPAASRAVEQVTVMAELLSIVQCHLGLQWRQSSDQEWHKALELHCTGTEGAPIHLSVSWIMAEGVKSGWCTLLTPLSWFTVLFVTWPSEGNCHHVIKRMLLTVGFKPGIFLYWHWPKKKALCNKGVNHSTKIATTKKRIAPISAATLSGLALHNLRI